MSSRLTRPGGVPSVKPEPNDLDPPLKSIPRKPANLWSIQPKPKKELRDDLDSRAEAAPVRPAEPRPERNEDEVARADTVSPAANSDETATSEAVKPVATAGGSIWTMKPKKRPRPVGSNAESALEDRRNRQSSEKDDDQNQAAAATSRFARQGKRVKGEHEYKSEKSYRIELGETPPPAHEIKLTRSEKYELDDIALAINKVMKPLQSKNRVPDAYISDMRLALQRAPFKKTNFQARSKVTNPCREVMDHGRRLRLPEDIILDAEYIYNKWMADDLDPDLLRGIDRKQRLKDEASVGKGKKTVTSNNLLPNWPHRKSAAVAGHNGLVIGQWWPLQICCLRDGAHGAIEAGIFANAECAVSVILSGGHKNPSIAYDDEDHLNTVYYCGTRGEFVANDQFGTPSAGTKAMMMAKGKQVRLIRSSKAKHKGIENYAPAEGFRYDGLYTVEGWETLDHENAMLRFKLVRAPGQATVRWKGEGIKPTTAERTEWDRLSLIWKGM